MTNLSVANITSVCKNKDNLDFVSAQLTCNVLYHHTLGNNLSVDKKKKDKITNAVETGVFYRHIFMVSCLKLFNK